MLLLEVSCEVVSGVTGERSEFAAWWKKSSLRTYTCYSSLIEVIS